MANSTPQEHNSTLVPGESIFSRELPQLLQCHLDHLLGSGIALDVIRERGYESVLGKKRLADLGFSSAQQRTPGILIPLWGVDGKPVGYPFKPDIPRQNGKGKPIKYENPAGSSIRLDCPPCCQKMLGDPKIPLWITEGSKKADALASRGACAISLTGVWGFKGKNEMGGVTFLADWDHITLKERVVYLALDSDIISKEPVKKALERVAEHLRRKGAKVQVIYLPQSGNEKVGIDDYLLNHSLEDAQQLAVDLETDKAESKEWSVPGFVLPNGTIGEMVVSDDGERAFVIVSSGSVTKVERYQTPRAIYIPTKDPLVGKAVYFPTTAQPYDSQATLYAQVKGFIHKYIEVSESYEAIAAIYVLLTWVFDYLPALPYLRVLGDWGTGKTRFLTAVGSICFRPIFASGATTCSPIFRILNKFRGTLLLDEGDFRYSEMWAELVKILNNGYRPGMPVLRSERVGDRWQPEAYHVFGPKLIATRRRFQDEALESRCLTCAMLPLTREDIPINLPLCFDGEVQNMRAQLLTFRLTNLLRLKGINLGNDLAEKDVQPRLNEIIMSMRAMVNSDTSMREVLGAFIRQQQAKIFSLRQAKPEGRVLAALIALHQESEELSAKSIAEKVNSADEEADTLSPNKVGWVVKSLGFERGESSTTTRKIVVWDDDLVKKLASAYGLSFDIYPEKSSESSRCSTPDTDATSGKSLEDSPPRQTSSAHFPDTRLISTAEDLEHLENVPGDMVKKEKNDWDALARELAEFPTITCYVCGSNDWWQPPGGGWICGRCHPKPEGGSGQ